MKASEAVGLWLQANPGASNAELYAAFPKVPRPSLRRLAASDAAVRARRNLLPRGNTKLTKAAETLKSYRFGRWQIEVSREFTKERFTVPLESQHVRAIREVFQLCQDAAERQLPVIELSTYRLIVQVALDATLDNDGNLVPEWTTQYITLTHPLRRVQPYPGLWRLFEDLALEQMTEVDDDHVSAVLAVPLTRRNKSNAVFIRPAQLFVYAHGPEVK